MRLLSTENIQSAEVFGKEGHYFLLALNENMEIIDTVSDAFSATQNRIRIVKAPKGLEVFESINLWEIFGLKSGIGQQHFRFCHKRQ